VKRRRLLALAAAVPLSACGGEGIDTAEWTEEVKLHDGRMIQVWRKARAMHGGFPNASRGRDLDFELKYEAMHVSWKGPWNRVPASFEMLDGVPHLVLFIADPASCVARPPTDYAAQFLRYQNDQWVEVPQGEFAVETALINLYQDYWGRSKEDDARGLVTWRQKAENDRFRPDRPYTIKSFFEEYTNRLCGHLHR
jgi:hypothetical protein